MVKQFYVVGTEKGGPVYYVDWWRTYSQPLVSRTTYCAKRMSRANANRVRRRLEDPEIWGGEWHLVEVKPDDIR